MPMMDSDNKAHSSYTVAKSCTCRTHPRLPSTPRTMQLRPYQQRIVDALETSTKNSIVVLPTGTGKTPVAACVVHRLYRIHRKPAVLFVPKKMLVEQQASLLRAWTDLSVLELSGDHRPSSFANFEVLVCTPEAFRSMQSQGEQALSWGAIGVAIFDEVHHVVKDNPYRVLALHLKTVEPSRRPLIIGLSACLTHAVKESKIKSSLEKLCADLGVQRILTESKEQIQQEGYHVSKGAAEVNLPGAFTCDVTGVLPESERKPHLMLPIFRERLTAATSTPCTLFMYRCIAAMETEIATRNKSFAPQVFKSGLKEWGTYAHSRGSKCAQSAALSFWYEGLRLLAISWEEEEDTTLAFLDMSGMFSRASIALWPEHIQDLILDLAKSNTGKSQRFENLKQTLLSKLDGTEDFRGIIFVQQRVTTHVLEHIIQSDQTLSSRLRPACLYATSSPATPTLSVSKTQSKERLRAFASGECNLLITTSVAEEGMDIPSANCVIRFDAVVNSVSLLQSRGRGRQEGSAFVVLAERKDRPVALLEEAERAQERFIASFQPSLADDAEQQRREQQAQAQREEAALGLLRGERRGAEQGKVSVLNSFCKKTKVALEEAWWQDASRRWCCTLRYRSCLRDEAASASGASKQEARTAAASSLLRQLQEQSEASN